MNRKVEGRAVGAGSPQRDGPAGRLRAGTLVALSVAAAFVALEVVLIPFPVIDGQYYAPADEAPRFLRRQPDQQLTWSRGWNFEVVNRVRVNNYGFVSDRDYDPEATTPLVAVIGDSFVEAVMVPYGQTCAGRLADHLSPSRRVHSFGLSGAPLSEYLVYAQWVQKEFRPSGMVFVIVANDFHESWLKYSWGLSFAHFDLDEAGALHIARAPPLRSSLLRRAAKKSRLFRYLHGNVGVGTMYWRGGGQHGLSPVTTAELNEPASLRPELLADSQRAIDAFFDLLPAMSGLAPSQVAFVVDGPRFALYSEGAMERLRDSHRVANRRYFMAVAERFEYEILDLLPVFADHWKANGARFDWPRDGHWNALGHSLCFEAVAESAVVTRVDSLPSRPSSRAREDR